MAIDRIKQIIALMKKEAEEMKGPGPAIRLYFVHRTVERELCKAMEEINEKERKRRKQENG